MKGSVVVALAVLGALLSGAAVGQEAELTLPSALVGDAAPPRGEHVNYDASNPVSRGYLSVSEGEGPFGSVILIHEWNGLVDRVRQVADALADQG